MRGLADSDCHVGFVFFFRRWVGVLGVVLLILENALGGSQIYCLVCIDGLSAKLRREKYEASAQEYIFYPKQFSVENT